MPESIASYLTNLIEFSKTIPFSQISEFIQQKTEEKKKLEEETQKLKDQIKILKEEKSSSELRRTSALYEENMTAVELNSYSNLKKELGGHGISINDVSKFAKVVHGISQKGYDVGEVINEFSDLESARTDYWSYKALIPDLKKEYDNLNQECSTLEQLVNSYNQKLSLYDELQNIGFGLKELKLLRNTINDIAYANNIPADQAQQKFYKDIEEQYDDKLGFELQLNKLQSEIATVNMNLNISRTALLAQPLVAPSLQRLFSKGIVEQDIIDIANLLERSHGDGGGGSTNIDKLRNQIDQLQRQKQDLEEKNQKMLSVLAYSDPVVKFLHGSDDSFSNDNDNVKILTFITFVLYNLYFRYVGLEKLADGDLNKSFVRLSGAAARGEAVPVRELKMTVEKSLEVLIAKLDTKSQASEDIALINNQQNKQ